MDLNVSDAYTNEQLTDHKNLLFYTVFMVTLITFADVWVAFIILEVGNKSSFQ